MRMIWRFALAIVVAAAVSPAWSSRTPHIDARATIAEVAIINGMQKPLVEVVLFGMPRFTITTLSFGEGIPPDAAEWVVFKNGMPACAFSVVFRFDDGSEELREVRHLCEAAIAYIIVR